MNFKFEISKKFIQIINLLKPYFVINNFRIFVFKIYFIIKVHLKIENVKKNWKAYLVFIRYRRLQIVLARVE